MASSSLEPRRPRLLPQNRKLRHLKGLSLRNLCFDPPLLQTTDDARIASSSPKKLAVVREAADSLLHPSLSSGNLRRDSIRAASSEQARPSPARRVSLGSAHASPSVRQKKLAEVVDAAVGDVFFSLHVPGQEDNIQSPIYISEVGEKSANFNFRFFDLADAEPYISRSCSVLVRVWSKRPRADSWIFVLEELIDLRKLNFIGSTMGRSYPRNALILHLEDGAYSLDFPDRSAEPRHATPIVTSSYSALMKLANLESSIDDAMQTRRAITSQINDILRNAETDGSGAAQEEASLAQKSVEAQARLNRQTTKRRDDLRNSLAARRRAIDQGREAQKQGELDMASSRETLQSSKALVEQLQIDIRGQRRRICDDLCRIFPIEPIPDAPPLSFSICGIPLSNSVYDAATARAYGEESLSAGLGLAALLASNLQFYLGHPLPYAITAYGSQSFIRDDISHLADSRRSAAAPRQFPLFLPRGGSTTGQWRFEYGWFLLNKDVEALCASQGLRVVDIRHSLANLKFLLYVCSAGSEELPERKRGGVRGLWAGHLKSKAISVPGVKERLADEDADAMSTKSPAQRQPAPVSSTPDASNGWAAPDPSFGLPFDEADTFTLRTKGLRENVAR